MKSILYQKPPTLDYITDTSHYLGTKLIVTTPLGNIGGNVSDGMHTFQALSEEHPIPAGTTVVVTEVHNGVGFWVQPVYPSHTKNYQLQ